MVGLQKKQGEERTEHRVHTIGVERSVDVCG
jgi:hypothetical protein